MANPQPSKSGIPRKSWSSSRSCIKPLTCKAAASNSSMLCDSCTSACNVTRPIKAAAHAAIDHGHNAYTVTQGIPELRAKIEADIRKRYNHPDRTLCVTSGTSGGLVLALWCTVNPGDEVIVFDPYFVMYPHIITLAGGKTVFVDTYPDFRIDLGKVTAAISPRTKAIIVNS